MTESLAAQLRAALAATPPARLCVAFSGGPDSTALLHTLAQLPAARARSLRAVHVDHGLNANSATWAMHCGDFCQMLDVPLTVLRVTAIDPRGEGVEAAARRARYAALARNLQRGEWLALAHHQDDQIETVLLKLLRGAGPEGLAGMRALRPFARGCLWRPLLQTPHATLLDYVRAQHLACIDDPANGDPRFTRNIVRHEILPLLARHWPHAGASILHTARLCRAASDQVAEAAGDALERLRRPEASLEIRGWLDLPTALRAAVLNHWLHARGLGDPPDAARAELVRQATHAAADRAPTICWPDAELRVWDGRLFASHVLAPPPTEWQHIWDGTPLMLPADCGQLQLEPTSTQPSGARRPTLDPALVLRFRAGGETIRPAGDPHTRTLRNLFQRANVPPWLRTRCPLLYADDELVAVADLWVSDRGQAVFASTGSRPRWQRPPWVCEHAAETPDANPRKDTT